jgi:hypothetical protein
MLTLDERGGEESGVEVRPECANGLPRSAGMPSAGCPEPVAGVTTVLFLAKGQKTLASDATRAISRLRDRDRPPSIWEMSVQ